MARRAVDSNLFATSETDIHLASSALIFLNSANPTWKKKTLQDMLYKFLEYSTQEVVSRLKKDWAADIEAYDKGHVHMLMFADMLTAGIVEQFPAKFKKYCSKAARIIPIWPHE